MTRRQAFATNWQGRAALLALALYCVYAAAQLDISWARFATGLGEGARFLGRMWPPNFERWDTLVEGMLESIQIAVLASVLGMPLHAWIGESFGWRWAFALVAVLAAFWLGLAVLDRIHGLLPEGGRAREFVGRLLPYRQRPSLVMAAVGWSFVVQLAGVAAVVLVARALGVVQPALVWLSVVPLVALAMVLPISIGGFGVRENALEYLLRGYGVSSEAGVAIGLLWGVCTVIAGLVGGVLFLLERQPVVPADPSGSPAG